MARPDRRPDGKGRAWRCLEAEGFEILIGKGARENDALTFGEASPRDLWLHAAGYAGSHVVIRMPDDVDEPPSSVIELAARHAAWNSKARNARGKVDVHLCRIADIRKPPGAPPGQVQIRRWNTIRVYARDPEE